MIFLYGFVKRCLYLLIETKKSIVEKVSIYLGLQSNEASTLINAISSTETAGLSGESYRKRMARRRFYNPNWVINAVLEARKLYLNKKKEEAMAVLGLAIYFALDTLSSGFSIIPRGKDNEKSEKKISSQPFPEEAFKDSVGEFKQSLSYIQKVIMDCMKKVKDSKQLVEKATKLVTTMTLAVISPPSENLKENIKECKKIKEKAERSSTAKMYSRVINLTSVAVVLGLFAIAYFNVLAAIAFMLIGTLILATFMKKRQHLIKKIILTNMEECSLYDEKASEYFLYP